MKKIVLVLLPSFLWAVERGATIDTFNFKKIEVIKGKKAIPVKSYPSQESPKIMIEGSGWQIIPAGHHSAVRFNASKEKLEDIPVGCAISSDSVFLAIESAPQWLQPALFDNFRRLLKSRQPIFAQIILESDPKYRDEIAFQVAHLSPQTLRRVNPGLLEVNAEYIYKIAPDLQYVELVEQGDPTTGDWYTTTKYRVIKGEDTTWMEIPKETYYWWVVMPKVVKEEPLMSTRTYNKFWRDYLYNYADPDYPLLKDVLKDVKVMWDGGSHRWKNKDSLGNGYGFGDSLFAVQAVGRWVAQTVPVKAIGNRPWQPNQVAHEHNGNCGELQTLLCAGGRTALIPTLGVSSWPGDHVWCEVYWEDDWKYYQVSWECGATDMNTGVSYPKKACIAGWRGGGYRWMANEHYNPVCTLTVKVIDPNGRPIDGAEVTFFGAPYNDPHGSSLYTGYWGHTDKNGELTVLLGTSITYGVRVDWMEGHDPEELDRVYGIDWEDVQEGKHLQMTLNPGGSMPEEIQITEISKTPLENYKLKIEYRVPYRVLYGGNYGEEIGKDEFGYALNALEYSDFRSPGDMDFFICDKENYNRYRSGLPFDAYEVKENSFADSLEFILPEDKDFYVVFSNDEHITASELLYATVSLYKKAETGWALIDSCNPDSTYGIEEKPVVASNISLITSPNPVANTPIKISYSLPYSSRHSALSLYDATGRKVKTFSNIESSSGAILWNGRDVNGKRIGNGVYFLRLTAEGSYSMVRKLVVIEK